MRAHVEWDFARDAYRVYVIDEAYGSSNLILTYNDGIPRWEEVPEGTAPVEPSFYIPTNIFNVLFDAMSEFVNDYGTPEAIILMAFSKEQERVDKLIDYLVAPSNLLDTLTTAPPREDE